MYNTAYQKREERFELRYTVPTNGRTEEKVIRVRGAEKLDELKAKCRRYGYKYTAEKLYPFSMVKNQHNFDLIISISGNVMHDMETGAVPFDDAEYDRMADLREKANTFFGYELPIAWVPYAELKEMKALANLAELTRDIKFND